MYFFSILYPDRNMKEIQKATCISDTSRLLALLNCYFILFCCFKADHQTAFFCIETAQPFGSADFDIGIWEFF